MVNKDRIITQYDDVTGIVTARYRKPDLEMDDGNAYIMALPVPLMGEDCLRAYEKGLAGYDPSKVATMSLLEKYMQIKALRTVRFGLPFHQELELNFYSALVGSYRARKTVMSGGPTIKYTMHDETVKTDRVNYGDSAGATDGDFAMLGFAGCGKSSAIELLVSHYPQVIMHPCENGSFPQIVYLVVNCVPNSNFSSLYQAIGEAIDKALGNTVQTYEKEIAKARGLGAKADLVRRYIEVFAIGIIIFDEIQLIDFDHTRENSFDALLNLANRSKVAIAVVGVESARDKMFKELRTSRRIGGTISANLYCSNKKFFELLVKSLWYYQWFDKPVALTPEIVDTLYELTHGIVDQLVTVYTCVMLDYINRKRKPAVDPEYIRKVVARRYGSVQKVLDNMDDMGLFEKVKEENADMIDRRIQEEQEKLLEDNVNQMFDERIMLSKVTANITNCIGDAYGTSTIEAVFKKVIKGAEGKSEQEITKMVLDKLYKQPVQRKPKKKTSDPVDIHTVRNFLDEASEV